MMSKKICRIPGLENITGMYVMDTTIYLFSSAFVDIIFCSLIYICPRIIFNTIMCCLTLSFTQLYRLLCGV